MKKTLFVPLMVLLSSCGDDGSFLRVGNSLGFACFIAIGLIIGAGLGYFFARIPNLDYIDVNPTFKESLPAILVWGIIGAGMGCLAKLVY